MHITLTGNLGSGKSTICKILKEKYGFEIFSTGTVQRALAQEMNLTTLEMNQLMCSDPKYDRMIDDKTASISRENQDKDIVFDSRLAWHFVEKSFKVFLMVSLDVAAKRVKNDNRGAVESYQSVEEAREMLAKRAETENMRYKDIYNIEYFNFSNYNLVLDSTYCTPEVIVEVLMREAKKYEEAMNAGNTEHTTKILVSPRRLLTMDQVTKEDKERLQQMAAEYKNADLYTEESIRVAKDGDNFKAIENEDKVKAMLLAETAYVPVSL